MDGITGERGIRNKKKKIEFFGFKEMDLPNAPSFPVS